MIEALNSGTLILNVGGSKNPSLIRGFLKSKLVADAGLASNPWLMDYKDVTSAEVVALVWLAFDEQCNLHYEVREESRGQTLESYPNKLTPHMFRRWWEWVLFAMIVKMFTLVNFCNSKMVVQYLHPAWSFKLGFAILLYPDADYCSRLLKENFRVTQVP